MYQTLQTTKMNYENVLGQQVFKRHNCNQSVSILLKFIHRCLLLYLLCHLYNLFLSFEQLFSLCSSQFCSRSNCLNFEKYRDTDS